MPSRSVDQEQVWSRRVNVAKWRFLIRNRHFRLDLNGFRTEARQNLRHCMEALNRGRFPPDVISEQIPDLSNSSIPCYERLYTETSEFGDPETLWGVIRQQSDPPTLRLGHRIRLDKVDLYCKVYDMYVQGARAVEISARLRRALPTIKSALKKAKSIIEIAPGEVFFDPRRHRDTCQVCQQPGQYCEEYEAAFQEFRRRLSFQRTVEDRDAWRYVPLDSNFTGEQTDGRRRLGRHGGADAQSEDD